MLEKPSVETSQVLRAWTTALMFLTVFGGQAVAQGLPPLQAGIPPVQDDLAKRHMSPLRRPCLTIEGYARPELANKEIYQHLIRAANDCGQSIKVQVCYYKSENCILMSIPPWESKTSILGILPALKRFQYEVKEQF